MDEHVSKSKGTDLASAGACSKIACYLGVIHTFQKVLQGLEPFEQRLRSLIGHLEN